MSDRFELEADCIAQDDGDRVRLLPGRERVPFVLNSSAALIWRRAVRGLDSAGISSELAQVYGISVDTARQATDSMCAQLLKLGVLRACEPAPISEDDMKWNILTVCTGNICRSVYGAAVLDQELGFAGVDAVVRSAGTHVSHEHEVPEEIERALADRGLSAAGHRPRQLTAQDVLDADLVLTATVEQRAEVLRLCPQALRRAFTLREAAAAAGELGQGSWSNTAGVTRALAAARTAIPGGAAMDIADPFRKGAERYAMMERIVSEASGQLSAVLGAI